MDYGADYIKGMIGACILRLGRDGVWFMGQGKEWIETKYWKYVVLYRDCDDGF